MSLAKIPVCTESAYYTTHPNNHIPYVIDSLCSSHASALRNGIMADLYDDVTYKGWGKSSAAGHRECMGNSKCVLRRSVSLLLGKTDRLHGLIFAT